MDEVFLLQATQEETIHYINQPEFIKESIEALEPNILAVGKSWDMLTFLLTGEGFHENNQHLLSHIWKGFQPLIIEADAQFPKGIAIILPDEVQNLSDHLSRALLIDPLLAFNPEKMESLNIQPKEWLKDAYEDLREDVLIQLEELNNFFFNTAEQANCILVVFMKTT